MRGWRYASAFTAVLLFIVTSSTANADEPKKKTTDEEIEESKATLAQSQAQTAPPLERGIPWKPSVMPWVLGGVGIAAIVTGGVFFLVSLSDKSKADDFEKLAGARTTNANEKGDLLAQAEKSNDNAKTNQLIGIVAGGAGVAFLGAGIIWAIADGPPKDPKAARLRVRPAVAPGIAGGTLTYAF
jgi:hypothetical protein